MVKKISALFLALVLCLSVMVVPVSAAVELGDGAVIAFSLEWDQETYNAGDTATLSIYMDGNDSYSFATGSFLIALNSAQITQEDNPKEDLCANSTTSEAFNSWYVAASEAKLAWLADTVAPKVTAANTAEENALYDHYLKFVASKNTGGWHENTGTTKAGFNGTDFNPDEPIMTISFVLASDIPDGTALNAAITSGSKTCSPVQTTWKYYKNPGNATTTATVAAASIDASQAVATATIGEDPCANGHASTTPSEEVITEATCTEAGLSEGKKCSVCGVTLEAQKEIPALGHTFVSGICACGHKDPNYVDYHLVGYINGADYGCEADHLNPGEYKFVDGKLVAKFNNDSYIFIKTVNLDGKNVKWYLFETYHDASKTEGILYENKSEKMFVPGGVEVEFTLTVNDDGSLKLALEYHVHNYSEPTCTEPGKCSCGLTQGEATGHVWADATFDAPKTCSKCGATEGEALVAVATADGDKYTTLAEALENGSEIVLLANIALDAPIVLNGSYTLDLNGYTLSYESTVMGEAMITNNGTLVINDSAVNGVINYNYVGANDASYGKGNYTISNAGTLTVNGGKITINGGNFVNNTATSNGAAIYASASGYDVIINGGVFEGNSVDNNGGAIYATVAIINGGTFKGNTAKVNGGAVYSTTTTVNGGIFENNTASSTTYGGGAVYATQDGGYVLETDLRSLAAGEVQRWNMQLN